MITQNTPIFIAVVTILGLIVQPIISFAKQEKWPRQVNALIAIAICVVAGVLVTVASGGLKDISDPATWATTGVSIYFVSQLIYHTLFKDSKLDAALSPPVLAVAAPSPRSESPLSATPYLEPFSLNVKSGPMPQKQFVGEPGERRIADEPVDPAYQGTPHKAGS